MYKKFPSFLILIKKNNTKKTVNMHWLSRSKDMKISTKELRMIFANKYIKQSHCILQDCARIECSHEK